MEREPQLLLPVMPPMVARLAGDTSTGKNRPCGRSQAFRWSSTMPGRTRTRRFSLSSETTSRRCLLVSMTSASPTVWPHCEVPAPRGSTGTPSSLAIWMAVRISSTLRGTTTPTGMIW
jgi:hypothetical protein